MDNLLVKFTKIDYIDSIIEEKLWASFADEFNDPFDARIILANNYSLFDVIEKKEDYILRKYGITKYHHSYNNIADRYEFYTKVVKNLDVYQTTTKNINNFESINAILSSHQMICLSKCNPISYESLPMWGYYADSGKGLCITYELSSFDLFPLTGTLKEITYELPENNDISMFTYKLIKNSCNKNQTDIGNYIDTFLSTKHILWSHEKEYRILVSMYKQRIKNLLEPDQLVCDIYKTKFDLESKYKVIDSDRFVKMPIPFSIILGWGFDYYKNGDKLEKLKNHCHDTSIKLFKLSCKNSIPMMEEI